MSLLPLLLTIFSYPNLSKIALIVILQLCSMRYEFRSRLQGQTLTPEVTCHGHNNNLIKRM